MLVIQSCPILCHPMDCDCVARQAPLFMEFSGQEYWNGLPFPPPGDLSDPGIEPGSPAMQIDSLPSEPPGKAHNLQIAAMFTLLMLSPVHLFATLWTVAHQAPLSMRFFRQEYWNGLPFPSPRDLPDPRIKPRFPALQADIYHLSHQDYYNCVGLLEEVHY